MPVGYVYIITNNANSKVYIGSTTKDIETRMYTGSYNHTRLARDGNERPLYAAMREIGIDNFEISILESYNYTDTKELRAREREVIHEYVEKLGSNQLYNVYKDGYTLGFHTEESRRKCAEAINTPEVLEKIRQVQVERYGAYGFHTQKSIQRMRRTKARLVEFEGQVFIGFRPLESYIKDKYGLTCSRKLLTNVAVGRTEKISKRHQWLIGKLRILSEDEKLTYIESLEKESESNDIS